MEKIKLVLIGQIFNSEGDFAFLSENSNANDDWLRGVCNLDPRNVRDNLSLCDQRTPSFSIWQNSFGWYYGISAFNPYDGRSGHAMVVLFLGHCLPKNTSLWVEKLNLLLNVFLSTEDNRSKIDKTKVQKVLDELQNNLMDIVTHDSITFSTDENASAGYCLYNTDDDLYTILKYPMQKQYENIIRLFIIPSHNFKNSKNQIWKKIENKVEPYYKIINSDEKCISVDKAVVKHGETLKIKYYKENFGTASVSTEVKSSSPYYVLNDLTLTLIPLEDIHKDLIFSKDIALDVRSESGEVISKIVIYVDGSQYPMLGNNITVSNKTCKILITADGYEKFENTIDFAAYNKDKISVTLKHKSESIPLKIHYKDRDYQGRVNVYTNEDIYEPLKELYGSSLAHNTNPTKFSHIAIITLIVTAIIAISIGGVIGYFVGMYIKESENERVLIEQKNKDFNYLYSNKIWIYNKLQSNYYKNQFQQLKNGDVDVIEIESKDFKEFRKKYKDLISFDSSAKSMLNSDTLDIEKLNKSIGELISEKEDKDYLINKDTWDEKKIKSKKYKNFMLGVKTGNTSGLKNHDELDSNSCWNDIRTNLEKNGAGKVVMSEYKDGKINLQNLKNKLNKLGTSVGQKNNNSTQVQSTNSNESNGVAKSKSHR